MFNGLKRLKYKFINFIVESVAQNSVSEIDDGIETNEDFKKLCRIIKFKHIVYDNFFLKIRIKNLLNCFMQYTNYAKI